MSEEDRALAETLAILAKAPDDEAAWRELYLRLRPFVVQVLHGMLRGRPDLADELCQTVFSRLVEYRPFSRLRDPNAFRSYLRIMCRNVVRTYFRNQLQERGGLSAAEWKAIEPAVSISTEDRASFEEVVPALKDLEPLDHELVGLLLDGASLSEMASRLGISYSNAAVRLHRIQKRLRKRLRV